MNRFFCILLWFAQCEAFCVLRPTVQPAMMYVSTTTSRSAKVALEPEPIGGDELTAVSRTMASFRMKNMGPVADIKSDLGTVYQFWMLAEADGSLVKEYHQQLLKDASRKANFPGFRKGQVPPFALPKIVYFSVREAIIKTVEVTVKGFGLKALPGSDGEVNVKEDTEAMCKGYRLGDSVQFTATLNAVFDPEAPKPKVEANHEDESAAENEEALSAQQSSDYGFI